MLGEGNLFLHMRANVIFALLLISASLAQSPVTKQSLNPQLVEQTVWGNYCEGDKSPAAEVDPDQVLSTRLVKPIKLQIYKAWLPLLPPEAHLPTSAKALTVIEFRVLSSGKVDYERVVRSSGSSPFHDAALGAISKASLEPFPNDM